MSEKIYDTIIIGGGPAGYTAALYSTRAGLDTLVLEKFSAGGQMTQTSTIDNYPGFEEGIDGFSLGFKMQQGAERFGAVTMQTEVLSVDLNANPKRIVTDSGEFFSKTVIIATGADHKHLGVDKEDALIGRGVGYCAACDGMMFRGKTVAVNLMLIENAIGKLDLSGRDRARKLRLGKGIQRGGKEVPRRKLCHPVLGFPCLKLYVDIVEKCRFFHKRSSRGACAPV